MTLLDGSGRGYAYAFAAATCFAANGSVSKFVLAAGLPADRLTELRCTGAALVMLAVVAARRPASLRATRRELPMLIACGLAGAAAVQFLYFVAIERLPVGVALLVEFTAPVLVALWARLVQRRPTRPRLWVGLVVVIVGLAAVAEIGGGVDLDPLGLAAAGLSAVVLAMYFLLAERASAARDGASLLVWTFGVGAIAWALLRPWWTFPVSRLAVPTEAGPPVWVLCIAIVMVGTIAPYLLTMAALRRLSATPVSLTASSEPVLAGAVAWVVLGEALSPAQVVGGLVVLAGIVLAQTAQRTGVPAGPGAPAPGAVPPAGDVAVIPAAAAAGADPPPRAPTRTAP